MEAWWYVTILVSHIGLSLILTMCILVLGLPPLTSWFLRVSSIQKFVSDDFHYFSFCFKLYKKLAADSKFFVGVEVVLFFCPIRE